MERKHCDEGTTLSPPPDGRVDAPRGTEGVQNCTPSVPPDWRISVPKAERVRIYERKTYGETSESIFKF